MRGAGLPTEQVARQSPTARLPLVVTMQQLRPRQRIRLPCCLQRRKRAQSSSTNSSSHGRSRRQLRSNSMCCSQAPLMSHQQKTADCGSVYCSNRSIRSRPLLRPELPRPCAPRAAVPGAAATVLNEKEKKHLNHYSRLMLRRRVSFAAAHLLQRCDRCRHQRMNLNSAAPALADAPS